MLVGFDIRPLIFTRAGIKTYLYNLIVNLSQKSNCRLHLFNSSRSFIKWQDISPDLTEEVIRLPHLGRFCERFWQEFLLPRAVARRKIEVFHGARFFVPELSCPSVVTIHDVAFKRFPEFVEKKAFKYFDTAVACSVKIARRIIVPSQATKEDLANLYGVADNKITVVHEAAQAQFCRLSQAQKWEQIKKKFNIKNKFIFCTGTIEPRKNIVNLLKAYKLLKDREYLDLVISGGFGWLYADVLKTVKQLRLGQQVIFTGYVSADELVNLYNCCEAFVFPSCYEGFGLPVLEAMQCGAAVVASNNSSIKELFGDACCLVESDQVDSLAEGIQQVLDNENLRSQLRRQSLEKAKNFSWEKTADQTLAVYESVI